MKKPDLLDDFAREASIEWHLRLAIPCAIAPTIKYIMQRLIAAEQRIEALEQSTRERAAEQAGRK